MATREVKTAGQPVRIELVADRDSVHADGRDLSFVTVRVVDRDGVPVPTADDRVRFQLRGDAAIAGVDNGDEISHAPFQADSVRLFFGKALAIIRPGTTPGTVILTATADGLGSASIPLVLLPASNRSTTPR